MALFRRVHDWAADHFSFVQYPAQRVRGRLVVDRPDWTTIALKWMALGFGLYWIWGGFLLVLACVLIALS